MTSKVAWQLGIAGVRLERGVPQAALPTSMRMGGFSLVSFTRDALTLGRSHGQFGPDEATATHTHGPRAQHPLVAASGNIASTLDHSSHPTCLPTPGLPHEPALKDCAPRGGRPETRRRPGCASQLSGFPLNLLLPSIPARHPRWEHTEVTPVTTNREGGGANGSCYLPVPRLQNGRTGHSTTLPSISPRAKQAFIAALAARLRRRAAQRIPKTEGNCSPSSGSPRLDTPRRTLFPRSAAEALEEVPAAPPLHRAPGSAPSFSELLGACLESSLRPCAPVGSREG